VVAEERHLPPWITLVGVAFLAYGLLTPWPTIPVSGLPAWLPTSNEFLATTGIPIQLLRALCAVAATVGLVSLVRLASTHSSDDLIKVLDSIDGFVYRCRNAPDWPLVYMAGNVEELGGYRVDGLSGFQHRIHGFLDPPGRPRRVWTRPRRRWRPAAPSSSSSGS
jgi:hypothetical protein